MLGYLPYTFYIGKVFLGLVAVDYDKALGFLMLWVEIDFYPGDVLSFEVSLGVVFEETFNQYLVLLG